LFCWVALFVLALFILPRGFFSRVCGGVCCRQDTLMMSVSPCNARLPALYQRAALVARALLFFGFLNGERGDAMAPPVDAFNDFDLHVRNLTQVLDRQRAAR